MELPYPTDSLCSFREREQTQACGLDAELRVNLKMIDRLIFFLHVASLVIFDLLWSPLPPHVCLKDCLGYCLWSVHTGHMCYLFRYLFIHWLDIAASCTHVSSPLWPKRCLHQPVAALRSFLILAKLCFGPLPCFLSHFTHSALCKKWGIKHDTACC